MSQVDQTDKELAEILDKAYRRGVNPASIAIPLNVGRYARNEKVWPDPRDHDDNVEDDETYADITICNEVSGNLLDEYAINISSSIQFPLNTCFLHGLAVVASAMTRQFRYNYYGNESPVNLYVVTAQPPSTGKSGVNEAFSVPVRVAYEEINAENKKKRESLERRVDVLKQELKKASNENQATALSDDIDKLEEELKTCPHYIYATDDATPEALENVAFKQQGMFNIVSAEADAINVMLGNVYSDRKANHGIFLKGWDGEWHSPLRITRETGSGPVFGSMAIIAQDESINAILAAGLSGRGISERILMIRERNVLGKRNHTQYFPVNPVLKNRYIQLVNRLVKSEKTVFEFSDAAMDHLRALRCNLEKDLADGGKYSHNMLRGAMGKSDKQIMKIACVLHAIENFADNGEGNTLINDDTVIKAGYIFDQLSQTYIAAAASQGYAGEAAENQKMKELLVARASKNKFQFSVRSLRDSIKGTLPFSQIPQLTSQLKDKILPAMAADGYCVIHGGNIYLNPKLIKK